MKSLRSFGWLIVLGGLPTTVNAGLIARDDAADPTYASDPTAAWLGLHPGSGENPPGMDDGGFGFEPWDFAGGFHDPSTSAYGPLNHFIDGVDFAASAHNDLGAPAFALANADLRGSDVTTNATRPFTMTMNVGDTFEVDFDSPAVYEARTANDFPFAIISFLDASDNTTFLIEAGSSLSFGDFNWRYDDAMHAGFDTGILPTATSDGSSLSLSLTSANMADLTFDGRTFAIELLAGAPAAVRFTLFDNTSGDGMGNPTGEREFFFNNLRISNDAQPELPGDYNANHRVEQVDLDLVLLHWGDTLSNPAGVGWVADLPQGPVDQEELDKVLLQWGVIAPEPGTLAMSVLLLLVWVTTLRRLSPRWMP